MIPYPFNYVRATSVSHALSLLASDADAKLLAGGHSLIPMMKLRLAHSQTLIDIGQLPELRSIEIQADYIAIGAATTHARLASDPRLAESLPLIPQAAELIADPTVRNRGTIGGSLANADPSADWPAIMLALDAEIEVASSTGSRRIAADSFFVGFMASAVEPGEMLSRIHIPLPGPDRAAYRKFRHPASGYAVAAAAVALHGSGTFCTGGRIGITGVAETAFRPNAAEALLGQGFAGTEHDINEVVESAFAEVQPLEDNFADAAYRIQLGKVMLKRALQDAMNAA